MSTIKTTTLSNIAGDKTIPVDRVAQGTAAAWVNFNGTGTVAIRAAFNVSSITDNGVGDYTANFTTALPDANYAANITSGLGAASRTALRCASISDMFAGSVRWNTSSSNSVNEDVMYQLLSIFR